MDLSEQGRDMSDTRDESNGDVDLNKLYFHQLPFHNNVSYDIDSSDSITDEIQVIYSDFVTNLDDVYDSGITSSNPTASDEPVNSENVNLNLCEIRNGEMPIPLQVVALAEGFGLGDSIVGYLDDHDNGDSDSDESDINSVYYYGNEQEATDHVNDVNNDHDSYDGKQDMVTCLVCFEAFAGKKVLHCYECDLYICLQCMCNHIETKISDGVIRLYCAGDSCSRLLSDQMISAFCPESMPIFIKNRIEVENNPLKKTCPNCHKVEVISDLNDLNQRQIKCNSCELLWCHSCYTPWHSGLTCHIYQKDVVGVGKKALKFWAKSKGKQTANARKCPSCHFYIERISGCDHMTCNR